MSDRNGTLEDPLREALRLIALADARGFSLRLMGGLAFHVRAPEWTARIARERRDIDLATIGRSRKGVAELLTDSGYVPDKQYNALYGHKQLYFVDPAYERPVDVLVDRLEMCHTIEFADRLGVDHPTLPLADLLLSKLQVVKINRKDVLDALVLLAEHPLTESDRDAISLPRIVAHTSNDWGWWRTATGNLAKLRLFVEVDLKPEDLDLGRPPRFDPATQIDVLRAAIDDAPKSTRWKLRSRVGDRMPWYEEPEEVGHGRD
ncbi:MAG: hypothetical protein Q7S35_12580 [Candidatus Limnocylindrales bacterium]|nr:hypothetical protein [Candidatus Limnocylindrales bacterium]